MTEQDPFAIIARPLAAHRRAPSGLDVGSFVALGDSFTAGTGCRAGEGWADLLAPRLDRGRGMLAYRNLAVDGATSEEVADQVGPALQLEPDLVTVICGANDVLRSRRADPAAYARRLAGIFGRLRGALPRVRIVTATAPEAWGFLRLGPRSERRVSGALARFNRATRAVASAYAIPCLEIAGHPGLCEAENFSADGLHPSALGHARAARAFEALIKESFGTQDDEKGETR